MTLSACSTPTALARTLCLALAIVLCMGSEAIAAEFGVEGRGFDAPDVLLLGEGANAAAFIALPPRRVTVEVAVTGAARLDGISPDCAIAGGRGICRLDGTTDGEPERQLQVSAVALRGYTLRVRLRAVVPGDYEVSVLVRDAATGQPVVVEQFVRTVNAKPGTGRIVVAPTSGKFGSVENEDFAARIDRAATVRLPAIVRAADRVRLIATAGTTDATLSEGAVRVTQGPRGRLILTPVRRGLRPASAAPLARAARRKRRRFSFGSGRGRYRYVDRRRPAAAGAGAPPIPGPPDPRKLEELGFGTAETVEFGSNRRFTLRTPLGTVDASDAVLRARYDGSLQLSAAGRLAPSAAVKGLRLLIFDIGYPANYDFEGHTPTYGAGRLNRATRLTPKRTIKLVLDQALVTPPPRGR